MRRLLFGVALAVVCSTSWSSRPPQTVASSEPPVITTIDEFPGDPWNLAVDELRNQIYVVEKTGRLTIVNGGSNGIVTQTPTQHHFARGVAADEPRGRIYVGSTGPDDEVEVYDANTGAYLGALNNSVIDDPDIAVDENEGNVYVAGGDGLVVFDSAGLQLPGGSSTELRGVALNGAAGKLYVSREACDALDVLDTPDAVLITSLPLCAGRQIAPNETLNVVYGGSAQIDVIDGATDSLIRQVNLSGSGYQGGEGMVADGSTGCVYATNGARDSGIGGKVAVLSADGHLLEIWESVWDPWAIDVNSETQRLYVSDSWNNRVVVLETYSNPSYCSPGCGDPDADALSNCVDNCPAAANIAQDNVDGDAWGDACDNCPATATQWLVPSGDGDCDGFTDADETSITTDPGAACGFTPGGDPASEAWPPDLAETNGINISDVLALKPVFGTAAPPTSSRYDIVPSGGINVSDVLAVKPFFGKSCTP